jgi:hypothetical protein
MSSASSDDNYRASIMGTNEMNGSSSANSNRKINEKVGLSSGPGFLN